MSDSSLTLLDVRLRTAPIIIRLLCWLGFSLSRAWHSRGTFQPMRLLARLCWAMLFAMGLTYAVCTQIAEHYYARAMTAQSTSILDRLIYARLAAKFNPFDNQDRG